MIAPSTALKTFFLLAAASIAVVDQLPYLRKRFVNYGSREATATDKPDGSDTQAGEVKLSDASDAALDALAGIRVPHAWFYQFYTLSLLASCIWAQQILSHSSLFELLASAECEIRSSSMSLNQAVIAWSLLLFQAARRFYECMDNRQPSTSSMWIGHWLVGLAFYGAMSIAIWIEASPVLMERKPGLHSIKVDPTSLKTLVALPIFALASGLQYDVHIHLASLKKYSVPRHPAFSTCICPHYLAECCIYASLAILAAPQGRVLNWTIVSGLVFVTVNLGVTAKGTRQWYARKFKDERIMLRPCMIPGIY